MDSRWQRKAAASATTAARELATRAAETREVAASEASAAASRAAAARQAAALAATTLEAAVREAAAHTARVGLFAGQCGASGNETTPDLHVSGVRGCLLLRTMRMLRRRSNKMVML
jgi:hypothetical protein